MGTQVCSFAGFVAAVLLSIPAQSEAKSSSSSPRRRNPGVASCVITVPRVSVSRVSVPKISVAGVTVPRVTVSGVHVPRVSVPRVHITRKRVGGVKVARVSVARTYVRSLLTVSTARPGAQPPPGSGTYFSTRTTAELPVELTIAPVPEPRALEFPRPPVDLSTPAGWVVEEPEDVDVSLAPVAPARALEFPRHGVELWTTFPVARGDEADAGDPDESEAED